MNILSGWNPLLTAAFAAICLFRYGSTEELLTLWSTGAIVKRVRNTASVTRTLFGGVCCNPNALRTSDNTTMMRVKEVRLMRSNGITESNDNSRKVRRIGE